MIINIFLSRFLEKVLLLLEGEGLRWGSPQVLPLPLEGEDIGGGGKG